MKSEDMLMTLRAMKDEMERPWSAFTGLVTLHLSTYINRGTVYALNPDVKLPGMLGLNQSVVIHPLDIDKQREFLKVMTGREVSDNEMAAMLYWLAHESRKREL